ncbi:MAG: hypothetical protein IH914_10210 [candidate division Zixibacteria bacterium]|nr:hypothetical protein [candidate division Zixibacteria bacterium]
MAATLKVVESSGTPLEWETHSAGRKVFEKGINSGVAPETIESIKKTRIVLKAPLETPVGLDPKGLKNFKSANVTLRKLFETYGNIRPARELPGVPSPYKGRGIDILVVRENVEDLYAGIEYMQTPSVAQGIKLITRKGCEKIIRLAFELARAEGRQKIHCATKANIMKFTDGLWYDVTRAVALAYGAKFEWPNLAEGIEASLQSIGILRMFDLEQFDQRDHVLFLLLQLLQDVLLLLGQIF